VGPLTILALCLGIASQSTSWYFIDQVVDKDTASVQFFNFDIQSTACSSSSGTCIADGSSYFPDFTATGGVVGTSSSLATAGCWFNGGAIVVTLFLIFSYWTDVHWPENSKKIAKLIVIGALAVATFFYLLSFLLLLRITAAFKTDLGNNCASTTSFCNSFAGSASMDGNETWGPSTSFGATIVAFLLCAVSTALCTIIWRKSISSSSTPQV